MTVCPNCGAENPDKSKWCGKCRYYLYKEYLPKRLNYYIGCFFLVIYCILSLFRLSDSSLRNDIGYWEWSINSSLKLSALIFGMVLLIFHCISRTKQKTLNILKWVFYLYNIINFLITVILRSENVRYSHIGIMWSYDYEWIDLVIILGGFFYSIYGIWYANKRAKFTVILLLIVFLLLSFAPRVYESSAYFYYFEQLLLYPLKYNIIRWSEILFRFLDIIIGISIFIIVLLLKNTKFYSFSRNLFFGYGIFRIIFLIVLEIDYIITNIDFIINGSEFTIYSIFPNIITFIFFDFTQFVLIPISCFLITKPKDHISIHHKNSEIRKNG